MKSIERLGRAENIFGSQERNVKMHGLQDRNICPTIEEISEYVRNPIFLQLCTEIKSTYKCNEKIEYSSCSWERGWNIKFKKAGKTLCIIYPRECYLTVMVVIGTKERDAAEAILPECTKVLREIYNQTQEGNGQKWLMIDIEEKGSLYDDLLRLIQIRRNS